MNVRQASIGMLALATLAGCATTPVGPTTAVMPAPGKPFEVFAAEESQCRQYAASVTGTTANQASASNMAGSMALGTIVGATAGALVGGHRSAGVGAAGGLALGTMAGANEGEYGRYDAQRRYNIAYQQCMYAKGNQVPGYAMPAYRPPPPPR
jgi:predicted lipid-binding transport protein (Tim44 family)